MGKPQERDRVYRHAMMVAQLFEREAVKCGSPQQSAMQCAASVGCYVMIRAGLAIHEVAERTGLPLKFVASIASAVDDVSISQPVLAHWLDFIDALMPRVEERQEVALS